MKLFLDGPTFSKDGTKIIAEAHLGVYREHLVIPLVGITKQEVEAGNFSTAKTESNSFFLMKKVKEDNRALIFIRIQGNYKAWIIPESTTGKLLDSVKVDTSTGSVFVGLYLLNPGENIILSHCGKGIDDVMIYEYINGNIKKETLTKREYLGKKDTNNLEYSKLFNY